MRAFQILVASLLLAPAVGGLAPIVHGAAADRHLQQRVAVLTDAPIAFPIVAGDPRVGFVVVQTDDIDRLRAIVGERLVVGAPARAASVPDDSLWSSQWGPQALGFPEAWSVEEGQPLVKVAIVDSGVDSSHPDLAGVPIENGTDYVEADATPQDENGHGTHVAGIVAAARDNGIGIAGIARVTLVSIRVLDPMGNGNCLDVALAVLEAMARGASIINLSLECGSDYAPLHLAIEAASKQGVLVVAAAGNHGIVGPCPVYPAQYPEVLSVAALDDATTVADYSCRGSNVELAAPGTRVLSTWKDGGYQELTGTSMAAPHVAGIAALVKSRFPAMDGAWIRARLDATGADLGAPGRDTDSGFGRVDPLAALAP